MKVYFSPPLIWVGSLLDLVSCDGELIGSERIRPDQTRIENGKFTLYTAGKQGIRTVTEE